MIKSYWVQKPDHICKQDEENCEFCAHNYDQLQITHEEFYDALDDDLRRLQDASVLFHMEQLSTIRYFPTKIVLRTKESDLPNLWEGSGGERYSSSPRVYTFLAPNQIRRPEESLPSNPLGESERKCRTEQDLLFEGSGFLRNGYLSQERWECFKRILERDTTSRGIWELGVSQGGVSEDMGDSQREADE